MTGMEEAVKQQPLKRSTARSFLVRVGWRERYRCFAGPHEPGDRWIDRAGSQIKKGYSFGQIARRIAFCLS